MIQAVIGSERTLLPSSRKGLLVIVIVVKHPVRAEYVDDWPVHVEEFTSATRAEPGNISFEWFRSADDPDVWLLVEVFADDDAGKAHVESAHFQAAIARMPRLLRAAPQIIHINGPGDGWSAMSEFTIEDDAG